MQVRVQNKNLKRPVYTHKYFRQTARTLLFSTENRWVLQSQHRKTETHTKSTNIYLFWKIYSAFWGW